MAKHSGIISSNNSIRSFRNDNDIFIEPVLPWLEDSRHSAPTINSVRSSSLSTSSDIHTVKMHATEGLHTMTVKNWKFWKWQKVWLLFMNSLLFSYGLIAMILGLCTYFKLYQRALVFLIGDKIVVNLVTAAGILCLLTSLVGFVGLVLNNRLLLTIYNILLWPCFGMICSIGYYAYRRTKWNIEGKLSYQWHYVLDSTDRSNIQANLHCCGYKVYADFHERSNKCYPRTLYPGCKFKYQTLTTQALRITWTIAFSMVPIHLLVLVSAILCANHVNNKFGKGLPPKLYRIDYAGIIAATPNDSICLPMNPNPNTDLHRRRI